MDHLRRGGLVELAALTARAEHLEVAAVELETRILDGLVEIFAEIHESVVYCLKATVTAGDLSSATDCEELARFLYASLQGAILESKVERSSAPLKRFKKVVFSTLLR